MKDEGIGFAGWLLADLVLVLAVLFLAIVPGDPEAKPYEAPVWTQIDLGEMRVGAIFNGGVAADGYPAPTYEVVEGELPAGILLDQVHGLLHGIPQAVGDHTFTIRATSDAGWDDRPFQVRVRPNADACRPEASFEFDQIIVASARGATWEQLLAGRVRKGLTKADELAPVSEADLAGDGLEFLRERWYAGYQIALIETFGGAPTTALARDVNDELARGLVNGFARLASDGSGTIPANHILLKPDQPRGRWSADYLANNITPGSARINFYFVKALPPECL